MTDSLFHSFAALVETLPAKGILPLVELEYSMLQDDLVHHRQKATPEARSFQSFRAFLKTAEGGHCMGSSSPLPSTHVAFYKKTVLRMIAAGVLSANAVVWFDTTFADTIPYFN